MKVFILGAGPVGLILAMFLLEKHSDITIKLCEKRTEFTRKQIVGITKDIIKLFPEEVVSKMKKVGCAITPVANGKGKCYNQTYTGNYTLPIMILQKIINDYIKYDDRITFCTSDRLVLSEAKTYDYVFGCEGGKSYVGEKLIGAKQKIKNTFYGMAALGEPTNRKIYKSKSRPGKMYNSQHRFRGFSSKTSDYYLGISIAKRTFEQLPKRMSVDKAPSIIQDIVSEGMRYYDYKVKNVSVFPILINMTRAHPLTKKLGNGTLACLVGDSTSSPHFFGGQGLNSGIREAMFVSKNLTKIDFRKKYKEFADKDYKKYHSDMESYVIPFERIDAIYPYLTFDGLQELAKEKRVRVNGITSKRELALLLSDYL